MSPWAGIRRRAAGLPLWAGDAMLAAATFVTGLLAYLGDPGSPDRVRLELTGPALVLLAVACLALVLRRSAPWSVLAATTVVGLLGVVEAGTPGPVYLPAIFALATVAARTSIGRTALAAVVSGVLPAVLIVVTAPDQGVVDTFAFGLTAWSGAAALAGIATRNQRAVVAAAQERATQAELTREEEAQRRVAEERLRIARDLHDVVAHHISVINVQSGVAGHLVRTNPDRAAEAIAHVREASRDVLNEMPGPAGPAPHDRGRASPLRPPLVSPRSPTSSTRLDGPVST